MTILTLDNRQYKSVILEKGRINYIASYNHPSFLACLEGTFWNTMQWGRNPNTRQSSLELRRSKYQIWKRLRQLEFVSRVSDRWKLHRKKAPTFCMEVSMNMFRVKRYQARQNCCSQRDGLGKTSMNTKNIQ